MFYWEASLIIRNFIRTTVKSNCVIMFLAAKNPDTQSCDFILVYVRIFATGNVSCQWVNKVGSYSCNNHIQRKSMCVCVCVCMVVLSVYYTFCNMYFHHIIQTTVFKLVINIYVTVFIISFWFYSIECTGTCIFILYMWCHLNWGYFIDIKVMLKVMS